MDASCQARAAAAAKAAGDVLTPDTIASVIGGYTSGAVDDPSMTELLRAVQGHGLRPDELAAWTEAMLHSGTILDWSRLGRPVVDKHSTGGVGDKVSLPLAPALAACGAAVPMVSGRSLGHSGGTLDKLESIPGFRVDLSLERAREVLEQIGAFLIGQTAEIAPADRRIYALRDATGTVACHPLIVSSIMSKKLAEGLDALVLDVKCGSGAFMKTADDARRLGRDLVAVGRAAGCDTSAWLTRMDRPLGHAVGNALEVAEALDVLAGAGPQDVRELTILLGGTLLEQAGLARSLEEGRDAVAARLDDGSAQEVMRRLVAAQGGDARVVDEPVRLPRAPVRRVVTASRPGWVSMLETEALGWTVMRLGAGRTRPESPVDPAVGLVLSASVGDPVAAGDPLATVHARTEPDAEEAAAGVAAAFHLANGPPLAVPLVLERLG